QHDEFRRKFVADPKGQFEEKLGTQMPASLKMTVHEEDENSLHFVIPMKPKADVGELSDEDLEQVAGGTAAVSVATTEFMTALTGYATYKGGANINKNTGWI